MSPKSLSNKIITRTRPPRKYQMRNDIDFPIGKSDICGLYGRRGSSRRERDSERARCFLLGGHLVILQRGHIHAEATSGFWGPAARRIYPLPVIKCTPYSFKSPCNDKKVKFGMHTEIRPIDASYRAACSGLS